MAVSAGENKVRRGLPARLWIMVVFVYLLIPGILIVCSGDWSWWQAWVYGLVIFIAGVSGRIWSEVRHPGLMQERVKFDKAPDVKPWDKILSPLMGFSTVFPLVIVAGLDRRYGWTSPFPLWANLLGLLLAALGYAFAVWALVENPFFSSVVRIQKERGHVVCDTGPYRFIRHPGYAGNILALFGVVLALDSAWTLLPAAVALAITLLRTVLEDKTLQEELPGYRGYAQRVRYRLVPWIY